MNKQGLAFFTDLHLPLTGLILFFSLFFILVALQIWGLDQKKHQKLENLPLEGD